MTIRKWFHSCFFACRGSPAPSSLRRKMTRQRSLSRVRCRSREGWRSSRLHRLTKGYQTHRNPHTFSVLKKGFLFFNDLLFIHPLVCVSRRQLRWCSLSRWRTRRRFPSGEQVQPRILAVWRGPKSWLQCASDCEVYCTYWGVLEAAINVWWVASLEECDRLVPSVCAALVLFSSSIMLACQCSAAFHVLYSDWLVW